MLPKAKYRKDYQTPDYTISDIFLDFQLDPQKTTVAAKMRVKKLNLEATSLKLDGFGFQFSSIQLNGQNFEKYQQDSEFLLLNLSEVRDSEFELAIVTILKPNQNTSLQGLYQSGNILCTQCEAEGFRQITYFLDRPDVLARYRVRLTADKQKYPFLLSNGNRVKQGELPNNQHWVEWEDPFPKPSYLFALVAGDFDLLEDNFTTKSGRQVKLELFVDKGNLNRADWAMQSLKRAMRWDEERFGLEYDLDIYMIVAIDFFNMGAMENKGLNIFNSKFVLADPHTATDEDYFHIESVIAHEYFHNWTGNRITCRDWFQLSLKEGLTVFRDQEFSSDLHSRAVNRINQVKILRLAQFAEDASPMSHPIRPEKVIQMNNFYTMTVYEKGAEVIRMIHTLLGEEKFQAGMKLYIANNDGKAVTCEDFVLAMEQASDVDLTLFRRWYNQSGTPELTITDEYDKLSKTYRLIVEQNTSPTADQRDKVNLHIPLKIALYDENGHRQLLQNADNTANELLEVVHKEHIFEFTHVENKPIPALLCDFSAPVKLDYPYTNTQLLVLIKFAENQFVRWDAMQMLFRNELQSNLSRYQQQQELILSTEVIEGLTQVLEQYQHDHHFTALLITMPKEQEFAEHFTLIDPDGIKAVRYFMLKSIAKQLKVKLLLTYQALQSEQYQINAQEIAKRALKNQCLHYLAYTEMGNNLVNKHYLHANNMTDSLAAAVAATKAQLACTDNILSDFEKKWTHDALVMDKWFNLQATRPDSDTLKLVIKLMTHPNFDLTNPNRVRALIGSFSIQNPNAFHAADGSGYRFLTDVLIQFNDINPQIASRLIDPLISLSRYDAQRQTLMKRALERLNEIDNLSADLFEKIEKALQ